MGLPFQQGRRRPTTEEEDEADLEARERKRQRWEDWLVVEKRIEAHWREVEEFLNRPSYGVPASKMAIVRLYMPRWCDLTRGEHRCAICLDDLEPRDELRMMPCRHSFHQLCIFKWLQINRLCPICQLALPSDEEQTPVGRASSQTIMIETCLADRQPAVNTFFEYSCGQ